jgi:hypothetical protein
MTFQRGFSSTDKLCDDHEGEWSSGEDENEDAFE